MIALPQPTEESLFDLTALIDVLFIVLLFFLLTAGVSQQAIMVDLPQTADGEHLEKPAERLLQITANGFLLDGTPAADITILRQMLVQSRAPVAIASDRSVTVERFLQVLQLLKDSNLETAAVLVEQNPCASC